MPSISFQYEPAVGPTIHILFTQAGALSSQVERTSGADLLIDTGASITCISPELAKQIGLRSLGKEPVVVASGTASLNTYLVDMLIPFTEPARTQGQTFPVENIQVMEYLGNTSRYQGLLGRDIIDRGIFMLAGWDGKYYFSL